MQQTQASLVDMYDILETIDLVEVLGYGPCSITYRAIDKNNGKVFALRTTTYPSATQEEQGLWQAQAHLLSTLHSPYIERLFYGCWIDNVWYCLKDFIHDGKGPRQNLRHFVHHNGILSSHQIYHIILSVLQGLEHASLFSNRYGSICHGGLKPENILLAYAEKENAFPSSNIDRLHSPFDVVLTDFQPFGLIGSQYIIESYAANTAKQGSHQMLSTIYRNYDYQAPEHRYGQPPNIQSDLFSVGVILYELLIGKVPCGHFPLPSEVHGREQEWDEVVVQCLQYDPKERYSSHRECAEHVRHKLAAIIEKDSDSHELSRNWIPTKSRTKGLTPSNMVYIPPGVFHVGSESCGDDALPVHECTTNGFYLGRTPVTYDQFACFVAQTGYITEAEKGLGAPIWLDREWKVLPEINWRRPFGVELSKDCGNHPVTQVSYADAENYAQWLGHRLPTEQEWEYAARGSQEGVKYPWGNYLTQAQANFNSTSTSPVMQYPANYFGLYDIVGNVWQWTSSWYDAYPGNTTENENFGQLYRVLRGGAWMHNVSYCLISFRNANQPERCYPTVGFRTACDI